MDWTQIIIAFIAGFGSGWVCKVVINYRANRSVRTTTVSQNNNVAGGNIAGRDVNSDQR